MSDDTLPWLRPDVYFAPTETGVFVRANEGVTVLSGGPALHTWLARLAPRLTGEQTVAQLCDGLTADQRRTVETIIMVLLDRGLVRNRPPAAVPAGYAREIAFVDHFTGEGAARFEHYRNARVIAIGSGPIFAAWERIVRESGIGHITRTIGEQADLLVHLPHGPAPELAAELDRWCRATDVPVIQAVQYGQDVWIDDAGWESLTLRLGAAARPHAPLDLTPSVATLVAAQVAQRCLQLLTGIDVEPRTMQVELPSLRHHVRTVLPHPFALPAAVEAEEQFLRRIAALESGPRLSEEELSQRSAGCYDDRVGVFHEMDEHDLPQFPLRIVQVVIPGLARPVYAAGSDFAATRYAANLRAFEAHCESIVDKRRFVIEDRLWGFDLLGRKACLVRACGAAVGAGYDWDDAVHTALVRTCRSLTIARQNLAIEPFPEVDLGVDLGDTSLPQVAAYDVTGPLGVPTFAFCLGDQTVAYTSAADPLEALRSGVIEAGWAHQAPETREPVAQLPHYLRGRRRRPPATHTVDPLGALVAAGYRPAVRPLDHDPAVHELFPYVLQVVLQDD